MGDLTIKRLRFDFDDHPFPTIILFGKRGSGKSTTALSIMQQCTHIKRWAAWCGTKETEDDWGEVFGSNASVYGSDEKGQRMLESIVSYQQDKIRLYRRIIKKPVPEKYYVGLIFDDMTGLPNFRSNKSMAELFSNGRHFKCVIIVTAQFMTQVTPQLRANTDFAVMVSKSKKLAAMIYNEFIEELDYEQFVRLLTFVAGMKNNHGDPLNMSLVYCTIERRKKKKVVGLPASTYDVFSVYRVPTGFSSADVRLGSVEWRKYNNENYCDKELERLRRMYERSQQARRIEAYRRSRGGDAVLPPDMVENDIDIMPDSDISETIVLRGKRGSADVNMRIDPSVLEDANATAHPRTDTDASKVARLPEKWHRIPVRAPEPVYPSQYESRDASRGYHEEYPVRHIPFAGSPVLEDGEPYEEWVRSDYPTPSRRPPSLEYPRDQVRQKPHTWSVHGL